MKRPENLPADRSTTSSMLECLTPAQASLVKDGGASDVRRLGRVIAVLARHGIAERVPRKNYRGRTVYGARLTAIGEALRAALLQPCEAEEWRAVPEFEGAYEVSDLGRVRGLPIPGRRNSPRVLRTFPVNGYPCIKLATSEGKVHRKVHRLVLAAFEGPPPPGQQAAHRDGDRSNPRLSNLRYLTPRENSLEKRDHGTQVCGEAHPCARLTEAAVREIRLRRLAGELYKEIAKDYGVSWLAIRHACVRSTWAHVT